MNKSIPLVVFTIDEQRYALHLDAVKRIVRAVEVTPLPKAPQIVLGVINVQGQVIPVMNLRSRFSLPGRGMGLSDQLIISHTSRRPVALVVDAVSDVVECPGQLITASKKILPDTEYVEGVLKLEDGLILIHDLNTFLSLEEEERLNDAMKQT
jgi:purine-binding chemotaxis protein CheW